MKRKKLFALAITTATLFSSCWGPGPITSTIPCDEIESQLTYQFLNLGLPRTPIVNGNINASDEYQYRSINFASNYVGFTKDGRVDLVKNYSGTQEKIGISLFQKSFSAWKGVEKSSFPVMITGGIKSQAKENFSRLSIVQKESKLKSSIESNSRQLIYRFSGEASDFEQFVMSITGLKSLQNKSSRHKAIGYTEKGSKIIFHYPKMNQGGKEIPLELKLEKNSLSIKDLGKLGKEVSLEMRITFDAFNHEYEVYKTKSKLYAVTSISDMENESGKSDLAILQMDREGKQINQMTVISASGDDVANSVTIVEDEIYICGTTDSPDFPIKGEKNNTKRAFVLHLNKAGEISGGSYLDNAFASAEDIIYDGEGNYWVTGKSNTLNSKSASEDMVYQTQFPLTKNDTLQTKKQSYFIAQLDGELQTKEFALFEDVAINDCISFISPPCNGFISVGPTIYTPVGMPIQTVTTEMSWRNQLDNTDKDWKGFQASWTWGRHAMAWMAQNYLAPIPATSQNPAPTPDPNGINSQGYFNVPASFVTSGDDVVLTTNQANYFTSPTPWSTWEENSINSTNASDQISEMLLGVGFYHERFRSPVYMNVDGLLSSLFINFPGVIKKTEFTINSSSTINSFADLCPSLFSSTSLGDNFDIPCLNSLSNSPVFVSADAGWWADFLPCGTCPGGSAYSSAICGGDPFTINGIANLALADLGSTYIADPPKGQEIEIDLVAEYANQMAVRMAVPSILSIKEMKGNKLINQQEKEGSSSVRSLPLFIK